MTTIRTPPTKLQTAVNGVFKLKIPEIAGELAQPLSLKLTAVVASVTETRRVNDLINGTRAPQRPEVLIVALQVTRALAEGYGDDAARAWLVSANPGLGMRSPTVFLRQEQFQENLDRLVACAVQDMSA